MVFFIFFFLWGVGGYGLSGRVGGGGRNVWRGYVRKPEVKRTLGGHRHRWEHNIKMDLNEIEWKAMLLDSPGSG